MGSPSATSRPSSPLRGPAGEAGARFEEQLASLKAALDPRNGSASMARTTRSTTALEPQARREAPPAHLDRAGGHHPQAAPRRSRQTGSRVHATSSGSSTARSASSRIAESRRRRGDHEWPLTASDHRRHRPQARRARRAAHHDRVSPQYAGAGAILIDASVATDLGRLMKDRFQSRPRSMACRAIDASRGVRMTHLICRTFFPACRTRTSCESSSCSAGSDARLFVRIICKYVIN